MEQVLIDQLEALRGVRRALDQFYSWEGARLVLDPQGLIGVAIPEVEGAIRRVEAVQHALAGV